MNKAPTCLAMVFLAGTGVLMVATRGRTDPLLDRRTADYLENGATGRAIAAVTATLAGGRQGAELTLALSASGPFVDPVPGFEGIRGANLITARELDAIVRERRIGVRTRAAGSNLTTRGTWRVGRRGPIPMRRLVKGRIVWDSRSERDYVLELVISGGRVQDGTYATEVIVDGRPRLRVRYEARGGAGRILSLASLDDHPLRAVRP